MYTCHRLYGAVIKSAAKERIMGVIENMKDIADLIKKAGDIELYRKIVESEGAVIELTRENRELEERVGELEKTLAFRKQMSFKQPFWYQEGDETPFCPACYEAKDRAIHLTFVSETRWDCPSCNHCYFLKDSTQQVPARRQPFRGGRHSWMG
jgi:hypothetical protein